MYNETENTQNVRVTVLGTAELSLGMLHIGSLLLIET